MNTEKKPTLQPKSVKSWIPFIATVTTLSLIISAYGLFLYETYGLVENPKPGDYGTLGDYIGGLMNPFLGFITVIFLIYTIRQNQEMIKQSQAVINLNTEELRNSTYELRLSQEALHKDATTNHVKFHFEMLKIIEEQIDLTFKTPKYIHQSKSYSFSQILSFQHKSKDGNSYSVIIDGFIKSLVELGVAYEIYYKSTLLFKSYQESLKTIIKEVPTMRWHFIEHNLTKKIKEIDHLMFSNREQILKHNIGIQLTTASSDIVADLDKTLIWYDFKTPIQT